MLPLYLQARLPGSCHGLYSLTHRLVAYATEAETEKRLSSRTSLTCKDIYTRLSLRFSGGKGYVHTLKRRLRVKVLGKANSSFHCTVLSLAVSRERMNMPLFGLLPCDNGVAELYV